MMTSNEFYYVHCLTVTFPGNKYEVSYLREKDNVMYVHRNIYYKHPRYISTHNNTTFLIPLSSIW